jgi:hypothetical protein
MNARTKLCWVDISRRSLREGLACGQGGVQVMLMMGDEHRSVAPSGATTSRCDEPGDVLLAEKPR